MGFGRFHGKITNRKNYNARDKCGREVEKIVQITSALHQKSPANTSYIVVCNKGCSLPFRRPEITPTNQHNKQNKMKHTQKKYLLPVAVRVLRTLNFSMEFQFTLKQTKKYKHICIHVCIYINPWEDILRFSVLNEATKTYIFRKHISVSGMNVRTAAKFQGPFQTRL